MAWKTSWITRSSFGKLGLILFLSVPFISCNDTEEAAIREPYPVMAPCPDSPNCVASDAPDKSHWIEPFRLGNTSLETAWKALQEVVEARPRTTIVTASHSYLHVTESSRIFGFVDDVEFQLRPAERIIAVRSASRAGYSDLGVNRRRIEAIRKALEEEGIILRNHATG